MFDIELKSVTKTFAGSEIPAVNNINLAVEKGSIITLLGPSGCGKTTTLRLIAGFEWANQGEITLGGKTVSSKKVAIPPEKRGVGMVFQDYALFPHLTVAKNVAFGYKGKDKDQRIKEVLQLVNLTGYEDRFPNELSGGQQQRVALARALTRRPVVVLLDEPFSNLDADLRSYMRTEIRRIIKEAGTTAVFVSHDQKDALAISDKVVVMKDGIIQQEGTPREIYQKPANKFVATFVGMTNLIKGQISRDGIGIETDFGLLSGFKSEEDFSSGEKVYLSIRPDSLEISNHGDISGKIIHHTYSGNTVDAIVEVPLVKGKTQELVVHLHCNKECSIGDTVSMTINPEEVAIIKQDDKV